MGKVCQESVSIKVGQQMETPGFVTQFPICSIQFRQICVGIEISSFNFVGHSNLLTEQRILYFAHSKLNVMHSFHFR